MVLCGALFKLVDYTINIFNKRKKVHRLSRALIKYKLFDFQTLYHIFNKYQSSQQKTLFSECFRFMPTHIDKDGAPFKETDEPLISANVMVFSPSL